MRIEEFKIAVRFFGRLTLAPQTKVFGPMVDHVSYEYSQVARDLRVKPEVILVLVNAGLLPGTKVGKTILIADEDLLVFLQRCLFAQAAKDLNLLMRYESLSQDAEALISPVMEYLVGHYGDGLLGHVRDEVRTKLESLRKDTTGIGQIDPQQCVLNRREQVLCG